MDSSCFYAEVYGSMGPLLGAVAQRLELRTHNP